MKKNIVFRLDCGKIIGGGHLMRCLVLARIFKQLNYKCFFISYDFSKKIIEKILRKEFKIFYLNSNIYNKNQDKVEREVFSNKKKINFKNEKYQILEIIEKKIKNIETIIVDHYGLSYDWEKFIKNKLKKKLVVIDDYFNRNHFCDILIDPTGQYKKNKKDRIVKILSSTKYAFINNNFYKQKVDKKNFIFISFGSMDKLGLTLKVVKELINLNPKFKIVVAISKFSKNYLRLLEYQKKNKIILCNEISDLNYYLNRSCFAVGAASTSAFENLYLNVPCLVFKTAANQKNVLKTLSNQNIIIGDKKNIKKSLIKLFNSSSKLKFNNFFDVFGSIRVLPNLIELNHNLKFEFFENKIQQRDALFLMRNTSQHFSTSKITNTKIFYDEHLNWCNQIEKNNTELIYLISFNNKIVGYIRYRLLGVRYKNIFSFEISIFVQDDFSNKNIGSRTLNFFNSLFRNHKVIAEIGQNNLSSINFFKKNNFGFKNKFNKIVIF